MHHLATLAAGASPARDPSLSQWEAVTRQALAASHESGTGAAALAAYEQALSIARQLLVAPPAGRAQDCVAALVVSCHNLADLHLEHGDTDTAAGYLCRAHESLIALLLDADRPSSLREAALQHSRVSHLALISHVAAHGPHPLITRVMRMGCLALNVDRPTRH
ncbi:DUF2753 family protein [Burkholderia sp. Ax-1719]|jgi:hypothetical protein|uniref:DUF2753 family protein n=1 Tax=Burkholderia sp. Ax-1719 TaxID=2608334 RepID=UPI0014230127|nr:DUF2753 family protein [Burkholderia sp. Ax-1719]NIE64859.1 DUF2753 family protein [Burkholderia sp. Ax-1719]